MIGLNVAIFIVSRGVHDRVLDEFALQAAVPSLHQYITYQFQHAGWPHLLGNMLFLWIFGNAVCDRMGSISYVLFYLAGGVIAGAVYTTVNDHALVGASGAIAAVTAAFLVMFPRVHVRLLLWFFLITTFELPAMVLIVFKIILWDNVFAPSLQQDAVHSSVAHSAHLGGYVFGFLSVLILLTIRALPRHQFDLPAVWTRWRRRTGLVPDFGAPDLRRMRRVVSKQLDAEPDGPAQLTPAERMREDILDRLSEHDTAEAVRLYESVIELDAEIVLPRKQQLDIANLLNHSQRLPEAVQAYESYLRAYPSGDDAPQVRLLAGMLSKRLGDFERAAALLRRAFSGLTTAAQRDLAAQELRGAEAQLPQPDAPDSV